MSAELTEQQVRYAQAWVLALESAKPDDRRLTALFAMAVLGNRPIVRCTTHGVPSSAPMTFTATYQHMGDLQSRCELSVDLSGQR